MTLELPTRTRQITEKIDRDLTGLNGSIFIHVDYLPNEHGAQVLSVRMSEKGKDGSTLDNILHLIGDKLTKIMKSEIVTVTREQAE